MTFRGALVDLDGTVYRGDRLLPGAAEGIAALRAAGIDVQFLSNNPSKLPTTYLEKLQGFGIPVEDDEIITSSVVTADYLSTHHPDATVLVIGEEPLVDVLVEHGVHVTESPDDVDIVLASMDLSFDFETMSTALDALDEDTIIAATNPDRTCPVEGGEIPDAGAVIGAIEGMTGRQPDLVFGKPSSITVNFALDRLGIEPEACLMIGDRLETDGRMGERAGMSTVIVLTGITERADLADGETQPTYVLDSLGDVATVLE